MIINILGHGLQWGRIDAQMQPQDQFVAVNAPNFQSVHFYCNRAEGFNGPDARRIVNGEPIDIHHVFDNAANIPEHFIVPHRLAWYDIVPQDVHDPNGPVYVQPNLLHLIEVNLNLVHPNLVHPNNEDFTLRLRQIVRPNHPFNEIQLAIQAVNCCVSLSWLIHNIPNIIIEHPELNGLHDQEQYTYRWLACRDFILELDPNNNQVSLNIINDAIGAMDINVGRLFWVP
ncbi:hypothetical protein [Bacteroides fragilis]|uniref:hypothetical protein n=1 Tax=Bacteroides fragilis TaxID=817 RepID=UPI0018A0803F|nr:hypothetical protein [Bacteroides fragilis]